MVMRNIKIFNLQSNWLPWDGVKGSITIRFLRERGDLRWRVIECVLVERLLMGRKDANQTNKSELYTVKPVLSGYSKKTKD